MTQKELADRCKNRNFDQIVVVVKDIFQAVENMRRINGVSGDVQVCTKTVQDSEGKTLISTERRASYFYANTELCFVESVEGETLYKRFLDRCGEGICCARERVSPEEMGAMEQRLRDKGFAPAQRFESKQEKAVWFDLTAPLGILFEAVTGEPEEKPEHTISERIAQINITTPDLQKTMETVADLLEIGPWEVGRQSNAVVDNSAFRVDGELRETEFSFLIGILVCGNIEWEAIQPEKGPLVYNDFIARRGIGFHHILQEIPQGQWQERLAKYAADGVEMACKGTLGPVDWCYMDTERDLHFYTELRTDAVMEKLPDGYLQYFYPAE